MAKQPRCSGALCLTYDGSCDGWSFDLSFPRHRQHARVAQPTTEKKQDLKRLIFALNFCLHPLPRSCWFDVSRIHAFNQTVLSAILIFFPAFDSAESPAKPISPSINHIPSTQKALDYQWKSLPRSIAVPYRTREPWVMSDVIQRSKNPTSLRLAVTNLVHPRYAMPLDRYLDVIILLLIVLSIFTPR